MNSSILAENGRILQEVKIMLNGFLNLTTADYIYAAITAFVITQLILCVLRCVKIARSSEKIEVDYREVDKLMVIKKCVEMFPDSTINFRGKVFKKGMMVRITTLQKRIIEGEIIGKNELNILCVIAGPHIIAHEMDKIEDITEMSTCTISNQG